MEQHTNNIKIFLDHDSATIIVADRRYLCNRRQGDAHIPAQIHYQRRKARDTTRTGSFHKVVCKAAPVIQDWTAFKCHYDADRIGLPPTIDELLWILFPQIIAEMRISKAMEIEDVATGIHASKDGYQHRHTYNERFGQTDTRANTNGLLERRVYLESVSV